MTNNLKNWLNDFEFGKEQIHKNLIYVPITTSKDYDLNFLTLDKALEEKIVEVKELEEGATVPEVKVVNNSEKYLIIFDGEHLIGAKQNRIVNKTIIVRPKSEIIIPVSCTEQGRWRFESRGFSRSKYSASSTIRRMLKQKMHAQHEVWDDIQEKMHTFGVRSRTSSLQDAYNKIDPRIEGYKDKISMVPNQVGFTIFISGEFAGIDVIGDPKLFSNLHESLISSYLIDAMYNRKIKKKKVNSKKRATDILDELTKVPTKKAKKIGAEKREELKGKNTVGEFVRFNGKPVHLALFPE